MHRLILGSTAYRQSSRFDPGSLAHTRAKDADPEVRLLWRQRLRRLEAEALRDAMLAASGLLNRRMFGQPVPFAARPDGEIVAPDDPSGQRRSIYMKVRRSQPLTLLQSFDQPVMETNCTRRGVSTVASQALNLLNSDVLTKLANAFAERVETESPHDPAEHAFRLALGRAPRAAINRSLVDFLTVQSDRYARALARPQPEPTAAILHQARRAALADLCQMLLSSNDFAYID